MRCVRRLYIDLDLDLTTYDLDKNVINQLQLFYKDLLSNHMTFKSHQIYKGPTCFILIKPKYELLFCSHANYIRHQW